MTATSDAVWTTHLLRYVDGVDPMAAGTGTSGGTVLMDAAVESQLLGDPPAWQRVIVLGHRSAEDAAATVAAFDPANDGIDAALVIPGTPISSPEPPPNVPTWAEVPHPPTDDDPAVLVLHVLQFHDRSSVGEMGTYTDHAARIAVPHGVRIAGWFAASEPLVGDGRRWDQVRFNAFPSKEAFLAVVFDPKRLEAQRDHREVALADTYTMILRPTVAIDEAVDLTC